MIPKGKDSGVKLKHGISFPQYLLSALGKKGEKKHYHDCLDSDLRKVSAIWQPRIENGRFWCGIYFLLGCYAFSHYLNIVLERQCE